jgi:hypothetical protein
MTQYLLAVHMVDGEAPPSDEDIQAAYAAVDAFNEKLQAEGAWVFAGGLHPADVATVVDATEHLGGFWVIEAADLDAAMKWAEEGSRACRGPVEVRPFQDEPEA